MWGGRRLAGAERSSALWRAVLALVIPTHKRHFARARLRPLTSSAPDFRFHAETGVLGVEVTELLRPASSNDGIVPVEEESFHQQIVRTAQKEYYRAMDAKPARVVVYFANARGKKRTNATWPGHLLNL